MRHLFVLALFIESSFVSGSLRGAPASDVLRELATIEGSFSGECTVANFIDAVGTKAKLAGLLNVDESDLQSALDDKCENALNPTVDLSKTLEKGPQFLKNFLDGGTTWNVNYEEDGEYVLSTDAAIIPSVYNDNLKSTVFGSPDEGTSETYPRYFSNFFVGEKECPLGVIECCYTDTRGDVEIVDNAEMCALDLSHAAKSNHIKKNSFTLYQAKSTDQTYCSGFAYEKGSFAESVKYNTFFHMAMMTNLYEKGYVKNIPGAPMCGCIEKMPITDNAACVKVQEGYTIDSDGNVSVNLSWAECGKNLREYYLSLEGMDATQKHFLKEKIVPTGTCANAAINFMNDLMWVPKSSS